MKIIISNYDDISNPTYGGGGAIAVHAVAKRLAHNNEIIVITGMYPGAKDQVIDGVRYKRVGTNLFGPKIGQIFFQIPLIYYAVTMDFDVWIETFTPPFTVSLLPLISKKPVIGLTHFLSADEKSKEYKLPFYLFERTGLRWYKHIIAMTDDAKRKILNYNPRINIEVIPNGTDITVNNRSGSSNRKYFLFLGRIEIYQKGIDFLIGAYKKVSNLISDELIIAGSGSSAEIGLVNQNILRSGLINKIKLVGYISGLKKASLIKNSTALVIPSRYEMQSLTAIESIVLGTPIVAFNIPGLRWLTNEVCIKIKSFNIDEFANAMVRISKDKLLRTRIRTNCKRESLNYDWDKIANKYQNFIESVVNN